MLNLESFQVTPGGPRFDVGMVDMARHGIVHGPLELVQLGCSPFHDDLHPAIWQILDPARNVKASSYPMGCKTKANALDVP